MPDRVRVSPSLGSGWALVNTRDQARTSSGAGTGTFTGRRFPRRWGQALASLALLLLVSCKEEAKKEPTQPRGPQAIPSDFVVNSFFGDAGAGMPPQPSRPTPPEPSDPASASASGSPAAGHDAPPVEDTAVRLVEPGEEPRVARKYDLKIGKAESLVVVVRPAMSQEVSGQKVGGGAQPPTQFTLTITPQGKTPTGEFDMKFTLVKAEVASAGGDEAAKKMAAQMAAPLKALAGLGGTFKISARGTLGGFALNAENPAVAQSDFLPLVQQALEGLVVVLPEQPIGKGAKWEEKTASKAQGLTSMVTATYSLKDVAADLLTVSVATTRKAAPQPIPDPRAPKGSTLAIDGTGTSNVKLRLDRMVMKGSSESNTMLTISQPGQTVVQKVSLKQTVENTSP